MSTPESKTMNGSTALLVGGLASCNLKSIADNLKDNRLIPQNVYDKIRQLQIEEEQAREIARSVTRKVEVDSKNFRKFLDVLKKDPDAESLIASLEENYRKNGGTIGVQTGGAQGGTMAETAPLDSKPTIGQLSLMKIGGREVRITESICGKWMDIGHLLDFDDMGNKVSTIEKDINGQEKRLKEVLRMWMNGESRAYTPATWRQLIMLLKSSQFGVLAKTLEDHFGSV